MDLATRRHDESDEVAVPIHIQARQVEAAGRIGLRTRPVVVADRILDRAGQDAEG
ncbi:hypothetical protein G3N18_07455 [Microbacterium sp. 2C]|uniref:hypothetical protein n=1 Tax=Microbacterium paulum TaxID=2707006 RepID=UPI0018C20B0E|nr:hypothetical protein [Microbacterium paulum]MBG0717909.1 hypothetical protein [Microbacterium paulum]